MSAAADNAARASMGKTVERERMRSGLAKRYLTCAAVFAIPVIFIFIPFMSFLATSAGTTDGTTIHLGLNYSNYLEIFTDDTVREVIWRTLVLAVGVSLVCTLAGFPAAYFLWCIDGVARFIFMSLFAIPLVMSYVIKLYSIRNLLGTNGIINHFLVHSGLVNAPLALFSLNLYGIMLTFICILLPFAIFPIFLSLQQIPEGYLEASKDLGATARQTFWTVIAPLALPGIGVALSFTFILSIGDFITPELVGGVNGFTLGRFIYSQFGLAFNWPFGAALSVFLMAVVFIFLALVSRLRFKQGVVQ
jgi:spermidine/putrescine transport system permease protein